MAKIYKRQDVYYADIYLKGEDGKTRRHRQALSSDKRIAEERLAELINARQAFKHGHAPKNLPWQLFRAKYLVYSKGEKKAHSAYRDELSFKYLEDILPITSVSQITPEVLDRLKYRLKDSKSASTTNRTISALKAAMRKAEQWGFANKQDWTLVKDVKETRAKIHFWTIEELQEIIKKATGRLKTVTILGGRAGLRIGEIYWLRMEDLDFVTRRINICAKEGWNPKDYDKRFVPMTDDVYAYVNKLPKSQYWVLGEDRSPHEHVLSAIYRKFIKSIGMVGSAHKLRHTFGSHAVMSGMSLKTLSKILGHASVETTEKHYAHLAPSHLDAAVQMLPRVTIL